MIIKQSVVDVLMFLFERYLGDEELLDGNHLSPERDDIEDRLEQMGFQHPEINQALDWLDDLARVHEGEHFAPIHADSIRIYSDVEKNLINEESFEFIRFLEQTGILTPHARELLLDRVVALGHPLDIEQIKWIIMIVLHSYPGEENAFIWMESLVFDDLDGHVQ